MPTADIHLLKKNNTNNDGCKNVNIRKIAILEIESVQSILLPDHIVLKHDIAYNDCLFSNGNPVHFLTATQCIFNVKISVYYIESEAAASYNTNEEM
jgi:hypothetical protein